MVDDELIQPTWTVQEVISRIPATARVFAEAGIDTCCGGSLPVSAAARARGMDPDALLARLRNPVGPATVIAARE